MAEPANVTHQKQVAKPNLFSLFGPYKGLITFLVLLSVGSNALSLIVPKIIASGIDRYTSGSFLVTQTLVEFGAVAVGVLVLGALLGVVQTYASEKVARDLRRKLSAKISRQSYHFIEATTPSKLLTNLTSDIDSIKVFVSQAIASLVSSFVLIIGASALLIMINWKLALAVLLVIPIIGITFFAIFAKVRTLFLRAREVIDSLNKIINESILGAALVRVLHSEQLEQAKFVVANQEAKNVGMSILGLFASMIPIITFVSNLAVLVILVLGGHYVITGTLTLGQFSAFNNYLTMLIFPILILGFMSSLFAQATASFERIAAVLYAEDTVDQGRVVRTLDGAIEVSNLSKSFDGKPALKDVSFGIGPKTKTAIIGPTAAGKTQLLYAMIDLVSPDTGTVTYDGTLLSDYEKVSFHRQVGFVFQDSVLFNMSLKENIAFDTSVTDEDLTKAVQTAELADFIDTLPDGLQTVVSERGTSLSGGQKQRVMLARALALNPKILFLDDFTARVDARTEKRIIANLEKNYPGLTLVSVTQKISSVESYDQILVLMEGELLAQGTHSELLTKSPEYAQMYESQKSTNQYELQS
jgi:ATP-binding cassette subfamily B protein